MAAFVSPLMAGGTFPLDQALTNFAKRFRNNALVADLIAPRVPTPLQGGRYWIFGREDQNILQQTLRAPGTPAQRVRRTLSNDTFFSLSHALTGSIPDEDQANYGATLGDLQQIMTQDLVNKIQLDREVALATMLGDTAQVTNNTTLAGTSQWSDYGNSNPEGDVETALSLIRQSGILPNFMILGEQVYKILKNHPSIKARYYAIRPGAIGAAQLAEVFGIDNVYVARAVQVDKAGTVSFVWGKNCVIGYVDPSASFADVSGVKTFSWGSAPQTEAGSMSGGTGSGWGVIPWRDPNADAKAWNVSVDWYYQLKITAVETLYLIKNAVA